MREVFRGKIIEFQGEWMSGLGTLVIEDLDGGEIQWVPCDNAPTVRALEGAFGNVIGEAHTVNPKGDHVGKEILWSYDEMGIILGGFTAPGDPDINPRLIKAYVKGLKSEGLPVPKKYRPKKKKAKKK